MLVFSLNIYYIAKSFDFYSGTTAVADIQDIVRTFRNRGQFKGLGGELMKQACAVLIKKCSIVHFPIHFTDVVGTY